MGQRKIDCPTITILSIMKELSTRYDGDEFFDLYVEMFNDWMPVHGLTKKEIKTLYEASKEDTIWKDEYLEPVAIHLKFRKTPEYKQYIEVKERVRKKNKKKFSLEDQECITRVDTAIRNPRNYYVNCRVNGEVVFDMELVYIDKLEMEKTGKFYTDDLVRSVKETIDDYNDDKELDSYQVKVLKLLKERK